MRAAALSRKSQPIDSGKALGAMTGERYIASLRDAVRAWVADKLRALS